MSARPLVAVVVGTDHHPFDRLVGWAARLHAEGRYRFHVQHGSTPLPEGLPGSGMLDSTELVSLLDCADAVVTHAGPGSIMDARDRGHVPVVVPRDPRLGEHVDDHQLRFARFLGARGVVTTAHDIDQLAARLHLAALAGHSVPARRRDSPTLARFEAMIEELVRK
ncbi:glycosyl transferase family 28 [Nocardioides aromaticivorans]|uniref:Glycosyl transferase family 28 n=1 Tax=Nocardioides aromaticivorans TaxID=200618 RepID=A0ABX7PLJ4_9ACTN|nr:glycosyltransferase [Nocardioides aromaticivorans]QSR26780.1 glycosyl transferase family 28 [Nocardioides aromaticivorans]